MSDKTRGAEKENATVAIEQWGLKLQGKPRDLEEAAPTSWSEVWRQVRRSLMRLVTGLFRLPADVLDALSRLARSTIPEKGPDTIEAAQVEAYFLEDVRQGRLSEVEDSDAPRLDTGQRAQMPRRRGRVSEIVGLEERPLIFVVGAKPVAAQTVGQPKADEAAPGEESDPSSKTSKRP